MLGGGRAGNQGRNFPDGQFMGMFENALGHISNRQFPPSWQGVRIGGGGAARGASLVDSSENRKNCDHRRASMLSG
jgi:hypothetical protein